MNNLEPIEHHLARIEAMAELLSDLEPCPHCHQRIAGLGMSEAGELPRAIGITHEPDCPVEIAFENSPAVEGDFDHDKLIQ